MAQKYRTLADYFEQTGKSQSSLARQLGVTRACVSYWVARRNEPSLSTALWLSRSLGIRLDGLIRTEDAA